MTDLLWVAPLAVPLAFAVVALAVPPRGRVALAVIAPVPALLLAALPEVGTAPDLTWLLLDVDLARDEVRRILLVAIALVWLGGGAAAGDLLRSRLGVTSTWMLALFGNLGVVLAADMVTLYVAFATLSIAAYPLIVHARTAAARRAGFVYLVMTLLGEALLLAGLLLAASSIGTTALDALPDAVAAGQVPIAVLGLVAGGFAVKVGVVPVHLWLPLAHPAAPVPASAVLSGAMIKAGVVGWLLVLPLGATPLPEIGWTLIGVGLLSIFVAAAIGVLQTQRKVVLAYSSVSQMGFIAVIVGSAAIAPDTRDVAALTASVYVLHHGLAKAALFLSVAVRAALPRWLLAGGSALAGLALAGAPLTSGYVAKLQAKDVVAALPPVIAERVTLALTLGAVATTLLMARFLQVLLRDDGPATAAAGQGRRAAFPSMPVVAWSGLLIGVVLATVTLPSWLADAWVAPSVSMGAVLTATWPLILGIAVALIAARSPLARWLSPDRSPAIPPGDAVVLLERMAALLAEPAARVARGWETARGAVADRVRSGWSRADPIGTLGRWDDTLTRWQPFGVGLVTIAVLLAWALTA